MSTSTRETVETTGSTIGQGAVPVVIDSYTLRLRGIRFETHIGAFDEERSSRQELVVDVDLSLSVDSLPERDVYGDVVDYAAAVRHIVEAGTTETYRLLETYAKRVVERLLSEMPAMTVRVAVTKKNVPTEESVEEAVVELVGHRQPRLSS